MNVLVVCAGNTCRSPMAAGLVAVIAREAGIRLEARSAGLAHHPRGSLARNAITAMMELGIDISSDYSKPVTKELLDWADIVVPVTRSQGEYLAEDFPEVALKVHLLAADVSDPVRGPIEAYRKVRDELQKLLRGFVSSICRSTKGDVT